jgi:hypothetical protein
MIRFYNPQGDIVDVGLKEARTKGYYPSMTSVIKMLDNYALGKYKQEQVAGWCAQHPRDADQSIETYVDLAIEGGGQHSLEARDRGQVIHNGLELFSQTGDDSALGEFKPTVEPYLKWREANVSQSLMAEASLVDHDLKVAGTVDEVVVLADGSYAVLDTKSQGVKKRPSYYDEWLFQLAGYKHILVRQGTIPKDTKLLSVIINTAGDPACHVKEWNEDKEKWGLEVILKLIELWHIKNKFG